MIEFKLDREYIELNKLLKLQGLVGTGGEAKVRIDNGEVMVNGEVEFQKRKKIRKGDTVKIDDQTVVVS